MKSKFANSGWSTLEYLWNPLLVFAATPFFLACLGTDQYGLWMLLLTTVSFGSFLNTGTGSATIKYLSAELAGKTPDRLEAVLGSSLALAIMAGGLLAAAIFSVFHLAGSLLFEKMGSPELLHLTGAAAAMLAWIEQIDNVFASALKGAERYDLAARVEVVSKTLQVSACAAVLAAGAGLPTVYLMLIVTACLRLGGKILVTRSTLSVKTIRPALISAGDILRFSSWGWLQGVGGMLFNVGDRFLVGSILGAASLAQYSIASQLAAQIHGLAAAGISVVFPLVSRKRAGNPAFSMRHLTGRVLAVNLLLSSALAISLLLLGKTILALWLGEARGAAIAPLLRYLIFAYWLLACNITPYYVLLGLGQARSVATWVIIGGIIGLAPMYCGTTTLGLIGAGAGRFAYALATLTLFIPLAKFLLQESSGPHPGSEEVQ